MESLHVETSPRKEHNDQKDTITPDFSSKKFEIIIDDDGNINDSIEYDTDLFPNGLVDKPANSKD